MESKRLTFGRGRTLLAIVLVAFMAMAGVAQADTVSDNAASWLIAQQIAVGPTTAAFPLHPGDTTLPSNIQGGTALGLLRVYKRTGNAAALDAAIANGNCQITNCVSGFTFTGSGAGSGSHRFATHDPLFLIELSRLSGDPQYAAYVEANLWAKFASSSYGKNADQNAADFAASVLAGRTGQGIPEAVAFDLSKMAMAAQLAGKPQAAADFMDVILSSLEAADGTHEHYDLPGLAAAIWASGVTGIDLDPASGSWAAEDSTADLASKLTQYQAPNGGFIINTASAPATNQDADIQVTAYAMQALAIVDSVQYASVINAGFDYIRSKQLSDGHFEGASTEYQGETMGAYAVLVLRPQDVYVDDDYAGDAFGASESFTHPQVNGGAAITVVYGQNAFATITSALANVANGGSVYVAEGTYAEGSATTQKNLVVDRPVNLIGAQASTDARHRSDNGASIIEPGYPNDVAGGDQVLVRIDVDDVSLDGFVLDGDTASSTAPEVDTVLSATGSRINVSNNVLRNFDFAGIYNYNYPTSMPAGEANTITQNWIHNGDAPSATVVGMILGYNYFASVKSNLLQGVTTGIQTNLSAKSIPDASVYARMHGNEIHASYRGIYHNPQTGNQNPGVASPWRIDHNDIYAEANPSQSGVWIGILVQNQHASEADVSDNLIDGSALAGSGRERAAYVLSLITGDETNHIGVSGGSVSHVDYGVLATDGDYYAGKMENMNVGGIAFNDVSLAAFYVEDTASTAGESTDYAPKITIDADNTYTNVAHQGALAGPLASMVFAAGVPSFDTVLVRVANVGFRGAEQDSQGHDRHVDNATIDNGIAMAADGGIVDVDAGTFQQNVVVNQGVTLRGAMHGVSGFDALRDGTGETVIRPISGNSLQVKAADAKVDGFAFDGATVNQHVVTTVAGADDFEFVNNRITNVSGAAGITTSNDVAGWQIKHNLFENFKNTSSPTKYGQALKFNRTAGGVIEDNTFLHVQSNAMQVEVNTGPIQVINNRVDGVEPAYTNVGIQVDSSPDVLVRGNSFANTQIGLLVNNGLTPGRTKLVCNSVSDSNVGLRTLSFTSLGAEVPALVFDNAFTNVDSDITNGWTDADSLVVGSNYYAGGSPTIAGTAARVADALPANPIGDAACGNNDATQIVVAGGSGQHAGINDPFADPLNTRVVDALGGAVMGQTVTFVAPANGASATLGAASGSTDFNGEFGTTATANGIAGSYAVTAASGSLSPDASFALTNDALTGSVVWDKTSFVYDGNTHTATAHVAEDSTATCTITPSFGPDVGDYPVSASCSGDTHTATGSTTAHITPAPAVLTLSGLTQTADGAPKPVTVTSSPSGVTNSVTYDGSATAPSAVGDYAVVATITDDNYTGEQVSGVLHISAEPKTDLAVTIADNRDYAQYGHALSYVILVSNVGNQDVTGASVNDALPGTLLAQQPVSWHCYAAGSASCAAASGSGGINTSVDIPVHGSVTFVLDTVVNPAHQNPANDQIANLVTVAASGDTTNTANNSATDTTQAVILRNGFELNGNGAQVPQFAPASQPASVGTAAKGSLTIPLSTPLPDRIVTTLASGSDAHGQAFRVEALRIGSALQVRVVTRGEHAERASNWVAVKPGTAALGIGMVKADHGATHVLLVGASADLEMALPGAVVSIHVVETPPARR